MGNKTISRLIVETFLEHLRNSKGKITSISDELGINRCYLQLDSIMNIKVMQFARILNSMAIYDLDDTRLMLLEIKKIIEEYFKKLENN